MTKHLRVAIGLVALSAMVTAGWSQRAFGAPSHSTAKAGGGLVYMLLPEQFTGRWVKDFAYFKAKLHQLVPGATVKASNANASPALQSSQGDAAITAGAKVIVLAAVDQNAAAPIVTKAENRGIPVIAYDRAIQSPKLKYYDSFDGVAVGKAQGTWLASHVKKGGTIVIINGSQTDDNAHLFNKGYLSILNPKFKSGYFKRGAEFWTDQWVPARAGTEMDNALTSLHNKVDGVLSANDGMAAAIVSSLARVHLAGIPVTGQDAQPDALGRIIKGTQGMSVYKPLFLQARAAAVATAALLQGQPVTNFNQFYKTHVKTVHAVLFKPITITKANVKRVVKDGFATWAQICAGVGPAKPGCGK